MSNELIGLDIGSDSIKLVRLKQTSKMTTLKNFAIIPLPPETIVDGTLMNVSEITEKLQEVLKTQNLKGKKVALSISGYSVFVRFIRTNNTTDSDLEEHIKWDAESYIPVNISDVYVDFQKLTEIPDQSGEIEVLLVAARRNVVDEYDRLAKSSGLKPVIMDVDAFALQNAYEFNYPDRFKQEKVALVNIGSTTTNINIVENGLSKFVRDISIGGMEITEVISQQYGYTLEEAEKVKLGEYDNYTDLVNPGELHKIYEEISEKIALKTLQTIDYYKTQSVGEDLTRIYLTGGGSVTGLVGKYLAEESQISVESLDPFNNINVDPKKFRIDFIRNIAPLATIAIGLALRKVD